VGVGDRLQDRVVRVLAERLVGPVAAGHTDHGDAQDAAVLELVQRGEQLALGEVAGGAEEHEGVGGGLMRADHRPCPFASSW
jgi:hypothetical protein